MLDVLFAHIHTDFILFGAGGAFLHSLHDRKLDPREVARYIAAGVLLSNFITPVVLILFPSIPEGAGVGVGFGLGYLVFRFCRFADRYTDKKLEPLEGPEHE
jgi:hypothetical protein